MSLRNRSIIFKHGDQTMTGFNLHGAPVVGARLAWNRDIYEIRKIDLEMTCHGVRDIFRCVRVFL